MTEEKASFQIHPYPGRYLPFNYRNFVLARWKRSYRYGNDLIKLIDRDGYYTAYDAYMPQVLNRENTKVRLALLGEDLDVAIGFSIMENNILHYVYVQKDFRRNGLGRHLVPDKIEFFTHLTKSGMELWSVKVRDARFNPFL